MMDEFAYRHLPVVERGRVIGVISMRDLPTAELLALESERDTRHALAEAMR
jgi:CBS domain-containing protein